MSLLRPSFFTLELAPIGAQCVCWQRYSEVLTLALFQQLRGLESERSFLRDAARFFSHLFPGVVGLHPSSLHRRVRKLRRFLDAAKLGDATARRIFGDLAYRSEPLEDTLARRGVVLATERANRRPG